MKNFTGNWHFILATVSAFPGIKSKDVRRQLCDRLGKSIIEGAWSRNPACAQALVEFRKRPRKKGYDNGTYTWYFSKGGGWAPQKLGADYGYLVKKDKGWHITDAGLTKLARMDGGKKR